MRHIACVLLQPIYKLFVLEIFMRNCEKFIVVLKILVIREHQELNLNFCDNVCFLPVGCMNYGSINS
jgi:hypothetical protein